MNVNTKPTFLQTLLAIAISVVITEAILAVIIGPKEAFDFHPRLPPAGDAYIALVVVTIVMSSVCSIVYRIGGRRRG